jgi:hypothetical protein
MNHLNFFNPYERKENWYEDALTRAFFVVLKYVPMAQMMLIELIREEQLRLGSTHRLPHLSEAGSCFSEEIHVQTGKLHPPDDAVLISLFLSGKPWSSDVPVTVDQDRKAVYDGVMYYGGRYTIIVENKPDPTGYSGYQIHPSASSLPAEAEVEIDPHCVNLTWQEILRRLAALEVDGLISGTEARILDDFLEFIDATDRLTALSPFDRFSVCKERQVLLAKRCRSIMTGITGSVRSHRGWHDHMCFEDMVRKVALFPIRAAGGNWSIQMLMCPGDTVSQGRSFYCNVNLESFEKLLLEGWVAEPHLHFSHINKNLHWPTVKVGSIMDYVRYWKDNPSQICQMPRGADDFGFFRQQMAEVGFFDVDADSKKFEDHFVHTSRQSLLVCPGLSLEYHWQLEEATELDEKGEFVEEVRSKIADAFACWGQTI